MKKEFWDLEKEIIEISVAFVLAKEIPDVNKAIDAKDVICKRDYWKKEFDEN